MRKTRIYVLLVLFCCIGIAGGAGSKGKLADLILVAGQSNSVGFDTFAKDLSADSSDKDVMFWWRCGAPPVDEFDSTCDQKWTHLQVQPKEGRVASSERRHRNFKNKGGGFGPEIGLARTLQKLQPDRKLAIVKVAYNGTSVTQWQPDNDPALTCYEALISEAKTAIEKAKEDGVTLRPRALVWVQGESDGNARRVKQYKDKLGTMIQNLRKDLDAPDMIALLGVNTKFKDCPPELQQVIDIQKDLGDESKSIAYVDSADCEIVNKYHFSSKGTLELGKLFAEKLVEVEKGM